MIFDDVLKMYKYILLSIIILNLILEVMILLLKILFRDDFMDN